MKKYKLFYGLKYRDTSATSFITIEAKDETDARCILKKRLNTWLIKYKIFRVIEEVK